MATELDPTILVWEYTLKCNSLCLHCGSAATSDCSNELSTKEALDAVDQIADLGFKLVVLSGGEPTLRKDWFETAKKIRQRDMDLGIISNGLHWKSDTLEQVASLDLYALGFSVDGEADLHDYLRGIKGSHKKIFEHIKHLRRKDVTICAITTVNTLNLQELPRIRNRLIVYGVDAWQLQVALPMGRMSEKRNLVLNEEQYHSLANFIIESKERLPYMNVQAADCIGYFSSSESKIRDVVWGGCSAGIKSLGLQSDGTVSGCLSNRSYRAVEGNIREKHLEDIWCDKQKFKYTRDFEVNDLKGDCSGCDYGLECKGGCQSQSTAFYDEFNQSPYCLYRYEKKLKG